MVYFFDSILKQKSISFSFNNSAAENIFIFTAIGFAIRRDAIE